MSAILYPVATSAEQALNRPVGRAARESEARRLAGEAVAFVEEAAGPGFATHEAAFGAYAERLDAERNCRLVEVVAPGVRAPAESRSVLREGRRWPDPPRPPATVWRLRIAYWRIGGVEAGEPPQARTVRKSGAELDAQALRAIARGPLRAVRPQKALDIGLFETRPPEAPHIVMPDE